MSVTENPLADRLHREASAYQSSAVILAATETGLFDALAAGPLNAGELAGRMGAAVRGVERLANALVALGWLYLEGGRYRLPESLAPLVISGSPESLIWILRHNAVLQRRWSDLAQCVRTGEPVPRHPRTVKEQHAFLRAMDDLARRRAGTLWSAVSLAGQRHLIDVGGGAGRFALEAIRRNPGLEATVVDIPESETAFRELAAEADDPGRLSFVAADALRDPLPPADAALVSSLIHIYGPEELRSLAAGLAAALAPGALLVIRDFLFEGPDHASPAPTALFAINMLINTSTGGCYSAGEIEELFAPAGFAGWRTIGLDARTSAVMATLQKDGAKEEASWS